MIYLVSNSFVEKYDFNILINFLTFYFYLDNMISRHRRGPTNLWAAMTHLTPTPWQFLSQSTGGFRFLSDSIAREVKHQFYS